MADSTVESTKFFYSRTESGDDQVLSFIVIAVILAFASVVSLIDEYSKLGVFRQQSVLIVSWCCLGFSLIMLIVLISVWHFQH